MAHLVLGQRREFGVQLALGASPRGILLGVLGRAGAAAVIGFGGGGLATMALGPFVSRFLYGVSTLDPTSYGAAAALLLATTFAAGWLPAWRAGRLDPAIVLRSE
jgi:ABC-type antimicrobial peptide transport system permease subunit